MVISVISRLRKCCQHHPIWGFWTIFQRVPQTARDCASVWVFLFFFNGWGWDRVRVNIIVQSNAIGFTGIACYVGKENLNREKIRKEMRQS